MSEQNLPHASHTPPAGAASPGAPTMSTPETLASIFFEPSGTFEALRERPRFLAATLITLALTLLVVTLLFQKIDFAQAMRDAINKNPRTEQMSAAQKEQVVAFQTGPVGKALAYGVPVVATAVILFAGAGLYMLGASLAGGRMSYRQSLSVWAYSSYPPMLLGGVVALVVLMITPAEEIDLNQPGAGLAQANLGILLGPDNSPALKALLGSFDLFAFYGLFLAAVGMRKVARLSSGAAWAVVVGIYVLWVIVKVAWTAMFGG